MHFSSCLYNKWIVHKNIFVSFVYSCYSLLRICVLVEIGKDLAVGHASPLMWWCYHAINIHHPSLFSLFFLLLYLYVFLFFPSLSPFLSFPSPLSHVSFPLFIFFFSITILSFSLDFFFSLGFFFSFSPSPLFFSLAISLIQTAFRFIYLKDDPTVIHSSCFSLTMCNRVARCL